MKHEAINSPVQMVPFADLYVSTLNPRTVFSPEGIEALAENIRQLGLIQNLAGLRDEAGKIGIVAGGRRLRALEMLQDDPRFAATVLAIILEVQRDVDTDKLYSWPVYAVVVRAKKRCPAVVLVVRSAGSPPLASRAATADRSVEVLIRPPRCCRRSAG